jgi:hypothetical protein
MRRLCLSVGLAVALAGVVRAQAVNLEQMLRLLEANVQVLQSTSLPMESVWNTAFTVRSQVSLLPALVGGESDVAQSIVVQLNVAAAQLANDALNQDNVAVVSDAETIQGLLGDLRTSLGMVP